tara:strand:+ start:16759 stop:16923 length:165 start_codon:yes stop_codon:yes gene_type:complete
MAIGDHQVKQKLEEMSAMLQIQIEGINRCIKEGNEIAKNFDLKFNPENGKLVKL